MSKVLHQINFKDFFAKEILVCKVIERALMPQFFNCFKEFVLVKRSAIVNCYLWTVVFHQFDVSPLNSIFYRTMSRLLQCFYPSVGVKSLQRKIEQLVFKLASECKAEQART